MGGSEHREQLAAAAVATRDRMAGAGVDRWELFAKSSVTREVDIMPPAAPRALQIEESGIALRTLRGQLSGFAASAGLAANAGRRVVEDALAGEIEVPFDPLPPARLLGSTEVENHRGLPPRGWAIHIASELAAAIVQVSDDRLRLHRTRIQEGSYSWLLHTGEEFVACFDGVGSSLLAEVHHNTSRTGAWREWIHVDDADGFDPAAVAARIADRALLTSSRVAADSGLRDVILHPEVTAQLLAALIPLLVAVPEDRDPLPKLLNRDGLLASPALTVLDDRCDLSAPLVAPCDGEGLPAGRTLLLEEGVPRHRLASYRDAVACSETPRGGALRLSYRDYPATGVANLRMVSEDAVAPAELLAAADRALYLLRPVAPIALDPPSDSYRIVASGVWLNGTQVRGLHPVVELTGSIGQLLRRIEAIGNDLAWFQTDRGFVGASSLLIRRQPVVG